MDVSNPEILFTWRRMASNVLSVKKRAEFIATWRDVHVTWTDYELHVRQAHPHNMNWEGRFHDPSEDGIGGWISYGWFATEGEAKACVELNARRVILKNIQHALARNTEEKLREKEG